MIAELRRDHPSIWLLRSESYQDCFVLYDPPLRAHFRRIHDDKLGVVDFEEIVSLIG